MYDYVDIYSYGHAPAKYCVHMASALAFTVMPPKELLVVLSIDTVLSVHSKNTYLNKYLYIFCEGGKHMTR